MGSEMCIRDSFNANLNKLKSVGPNRAAFSALANRRLNSGKWIAIGYLIYSSGRRELNYVWGPRFSTRTFDIQQASFSGFNKYGDIRIVEIEQCSEKLANKFARKRAAKIGRPEIAEIQLAIDRAAARIPGFWDPRRHKDAVYEARRELARIKSGDKMELSQITDDMLESESAIDKAIRRRR